uniref:diphosphoinositol polyphosphate phosphohydrolase 1 n=1 Tax=Myxine glutinosa TaxID=7769 RepID=UPI00358E7EB7
MDGKANHHARTYDTDGFVRRAACLCFRNASEQEVLLVSTKRCPDKWIVPGGGLEPTEEPGVAAVREVLEEAGVKGELGRMLGVFENQDRRHRTYVFVLIVTELLDHWEDSENLGRKREWFSVDDAISVLKRDKPVQASYLQKLKEGYANGTGPCIGQVTEPELAEDLQ